jgi:hypothetical protein
MTTCHFMHCYWQYNKARCIPFFTLFYFKLGPNFYFALYTQITKQHYAFLYVVL